MSNNIFIIDSEVIYLGLGEVKLDIDPHVNIPVSIDIEIEFPLDDILKTFIDLGIKETDTADKAEEYLNSVKP